MPFRVVSGVGQGMGVLDEVVIVEGEGAVLGVNLGRPIVTNGAFAARSSQITLRTCCNASMSSFLSDRRCSLSNAGIKL